MHTVEPADFIKLLKSVCACAASPSEINLLVRHAHRLALTRLRQLAASGKLYFQPLPITLDVVAFDCIADLFARDDNGEFVELCNYFSEDRDIAVLGPESAASHFRRLVFSTLHDGIFRLYQENDPVLGKILRNLKIALSKRSHIQQFERFGQLHVSRYPEEERNEHLTEFPIDDLENILIAKPGQWTNTSQFLILTLDVLSEYREYRQFYALLDIAIVLKHILTRQHVSTLQIAHENEDYLRFDLEEVVENCISSARYDLHRKYVYTKKLTEQEFHQYFNAISENLQDVFIHDGMNEQPLFFYFKNHVPNIDYDEYRTKFRPQFEYMSRLAKKKVRDELKNYI